MFLNIILCWVGILFFETPTSDGPSPLGESLSHRLYQPPGLSYCLNWWCTVRTENEVVLGLRPMHEVGGKSLKHSLTNHQGTQIVLLRHAFCLKFNKGEKNCISYIHNGCGLVFLFLAKFCQISTWKIWFQPIQKFYYEKIWPTFTRFQTKKNPNYQIFMISSRR